MRERMVWISWIVEKAFAKEVYSLIPSRYVLGVIVTGRVGQEEIETRQEGRDGDDEDVRERNEE